MKYLKYLIFTLFLFTFSLNVKAYSNMNTTFNFDIPNYDDILDNYTCGTENVRDFFHNYIDNLDLSNLNYRLFMRLGTNNDEFRIYVLPKLSSGSRDRINFYLQNHNGTYRSVLTRVFANTTKAYYEFRLDFENCDTNISTSQSWLAYLNYVNSGTYTYTTDSNGDFLKKSNDSQVPIIYQNVGTTTPNNDEDFDIIDNTNWFYYSSVQLNFNQDNLSNSTTLFEKSLHINNNNTTYQKTDDIPSFYDIQDTFPDNPTEETFIDYMDYLPTIYTYIEPTDISNYNTTLRFNVSNSIVSSLPTADEYVSNVIFNSICSARIDNTNYFSYKTFPCTLTTTYSINGDSITYNFTNVSYTENLSNYDRIFITINPSYIDNDFNKSIGDLRGLSNGKLILTKYKGIIYDSISPLALNFKLFLTSNNSISNADVYIREYSFIDYRINYMGFSTSTQNQNVVFGSSVLGDINSGESLSSQVDTIKFLKVQVSNDIDTGIMIYQQYSDIPLFELELFFNEGLVISLNNNINSDSFYYIDDTGTITNNDYIIPERFIEDKYDIAYYISVVNDFINDLSTDSLNIANLTQTFYNGLPTIFQTFLFVLFILACMYFLYLLIKR